MWTSHCIAIAALALLACGTLVPADSYAQLGDVFGKAKKKVEKKVDKEADKAIDRALESDADSEGEATAVRGAPGEGVWLNYDFVPGSRVIFYEDFSGEDVGNFPRRLEFLSGNLEVAEWKGRRWLRASSRSDFLVPLPEVLPDRFTLEFEYLTNGNSMGAIIRYDDVAKGPAYTEFRHHVAGIKGGGLSAMTRTDDPSRKSKPFHCRVLGDGDYVKVFSNETRVANVPKAPIGRNRFLRIHLPGTASNPVMMTDLRVAESNRKIYDELEANGRVVLKGILFDIDSDRIRPESTPTLKEIGQMLGTHPELNLVIEGHTDSQGDDAHNQDLSERRAQAVRAYLIRRHGVGETRITAIGLGESRPKVSNETPEGRQNNRRVELAVSEG